MSNATLRCALLAVFAAVHGIAFAGIPAESSLELYAESLQLAHAPDDARGRDATERAQRAQERTQATAERARERALAKAGERAEAAIDHANAALMLHGLGRREVVKNAPFTADVVYRTEQVLADGNRISRTTESMFARDSQGRTRQSRGASIVMIDDPVAKQTFLLHPDRKLAIRLPSLPAIPAPPAPPNPPAVGAQPPVPPAPPPPPIATLDERVISVYPGRVVVHRTSRNEPGDARVEVVRIVTADGADPTLAAAGVTPGMPVELPPLTLHGSPLTVPLTGRGKGATEKLGTQDIEGVRAEGTRTTYTIAAGTIGNEKAIVSTSEQWYSPELQAIVLTRSSDPRAGETTYRLTNIRRGEPAAELFRVPTDYRER